MIRADTIIISDIHLGSETSRTDDLDRFLKSLKCRTLILNGDIFDDLNFKRLRRTHWNILSDLRWWSKRIRVVWIRGNHDTLSADTLSHLLGLEVRADYEWRSGKRVFFAAHGDRWDIYIYKHPRLAALLTRIHRFLQKHFPRMSERMARRLKKNNVFLSRNSAAVEFSAFRLARKRGYSAVFCGHTHMPLLKKDGRTVYANSGSWQDDAPHFIALSRNDVSLCRYGGGKARVVSRVELG